MSLINRARATGLRTLTVWLLVTALALAFLHHTDHVLRVDHSGWPFIGAVTPFTFSLLAYPTILFAMFGPQRAIWLRWALLAGAAGFTLYAHVVVENPRMQFHMWAENSSLDPLAHSAHNLPGVRSPLLGAISVTLSMALNLMAVIAAASMLRDSIKPPSSPS